VEIWKKSLLDNKPAVTTKEQRELLVLKRRPCQGGTEDYFDSECLSSEQVVESTVIKLPLII
jgi:hypothetical protein